MKKEQISFFATIIIGGAALYYFLIYKKNKAKSKEDYVYNIASKVKTSSAATLNTFELGFLQAWSNALDSNAKTFMYNGKNYDGYLGKTIL
jgi:hypothetical protein